MSKIYYFCSDEQYQPEELLKHAVAAEIAGFDGIMISEHFHPWVEDIGSSGFAFTTLGAIAVLTKTVHLMTAVTSPLFRLHPAVLAQASATIDRLSGGRFELGVGTGENINEKPVGFTLPPYRERAIMLKEASEIISKLLSGESVTYDGKYYQTKSAKLYSPPLSKVPIFMAAGGPQSATTAGKQYDGVILSVKDIKSALDNVITPALDATELKDFNIIANRWSVHAKSNDEAWDALKAQRGLRAPSREAGLTPYELQSEADSLPKSEILSKFAIVSSAQDYIDLYSPLIVDLKADIIGIQTTSLNQLDTIAMLGKDVLPKLHKL